MAGWGVVQVAVAFGWLGMVLAISFLEAPLKFRAPGITIPIGLGIGRLVFTALNRVELVFAVVLSVALAVEHAGAGAVEVILLAIVVGVLIVQVGLLRPVMNKRSDRVVAGETLPRSRNHHVYVALESTKVIALLVLAIRLTAAPG